MSLKLEEHARIYNVVIQDENFLGEDKTYMSNELSEDERFLVEYMIQRIDYSSEDGIGFNMKQFQSLTVKRISDTERLFDLSFFDRPNQILKITQVKQNVYRINFYQVMFGFLGYINVLKKYSKDEK